MSSWPAYNSVPPRVSVLIVVYNAVAEARDCLASLAKQASDPIEIVIVDNASPQGGADSLARLFPQIKLIQNQENVGFARAVNQAAAVSRGQYLLLLNPDTRLGNDALKLLADWLEEHPAAGLAGPRLVNPDSSLQTSTYRFPDLAQSAAHLFLLKKLLPLSWLRRLAPAWLGRRVGQLSRHDRPQPVDYCTGAALMLRRRVWEELGGLDERFFLYYEEKDFCQRAARAGWQTWFVPQAEIGHAIGASAKTAPQTAALARYASMLAYFAKHQPHNLPALRLILKAGAVFRYLLSRLAGRVEEAQTWRQVGRLAKKKPPKKNYSPCRR